MNVQVTEFDAIQQLVPELQAEGYEVFLQPSQAQLPPFLKNYSPDAIALSRDKNLAIEVIRKNRLGEKKRNKSRAFLRDTMIGS